MDERAEMAAFCEQALPELVAALTHQFVDRWLAQELAQEALIRACDRWAKVRTYASPTGWAFRVGVNLGRSRLRRQRAERRALARHSAALHEATTEPSVETLDLRRALAALSETHRQVIVLRYFLGLSAIDAAEVVGTTAGAMRTRTSRAVAALRANLGTTEGSGRRG